MARKTRRVTTSPPSPNNGQARTGFFSYILTALLAAGLSAGGTYFALRPALTQAAVARTLNADAAAALGNAAFDQKNWPAAIANYTQAIAAGEDTPDIRTDLGIAYLFAGQPQIALKQYKIAQQENPQHENSLFNQGDAYADMNNAPQAVAAWQLYLQRFPQGQHAANARAFIAAVQAHEPGK